MRTFREVWADKEAEGYQYGEDALEQVRFGWDLFQSELECVPSQELVAALLERASDDPRSLLVGMLDRVWADDLLADLHELLIERGKRSASYDTPADDETKEYQRFMSRAASIVRFEQRTTKRRVKSSSEVEGD